MSELCFICLISLCCDLCPDNLEGTSIAIYTGVYSFALVMSSYFGSLTQKTFDINENNYSELYLLLIISNLYVCVAIIFTISVELPNPQTAIKELSDDSINKLD